MSSEDRATLTALFMALVSFLILFGVAIPSCVDKRNARVMECLTMRPQLAPKECSDSLK